MTERHYSDDEVAAIFRAAAEGSSAGTLRLPSWARQRRQQMDGIAERVLAATK
jgi:hypothetical protein